MNLPKVSSVGREGHSNRARLKTQEKKQWSCSLCVYLTVEVTVNHTIMLLLVSSTNRCPLTFTGHILFHCQMSGKWCREGGELFVVPFFLETRSERDMCTPMFITALFVIARAWKQPRCPSADKWIRKLWYIYTMEYYSAIKKNSFESVLMRWMKVEPIIQSEVSQKDDLQIILDTI